MKKALQIINNKKLGVLIIRNKLGNTGIITDGDLKRIAQKYNKFDNLKIKQVMKNPLSIEENQLAVSIIHDEYKENYIFVCSQKRETKRL